MVSSFLIGIYSVLINEEQACNNKQLEGKETYFLFYMTHFTLGQHHWLWLMVFWVLIEFTLCQWWKPNIHGFAVWRRSIKLLKICWPCHPKWKLPLKFRSHLGFGQQVKTDRLLPWIKTTRCFTVNHKKEIYLLIAEKTHISIATCMGGPQRKKLLNLLSPLRPWETTSNFWEQKPKTTA